MERDRPLTQFRLSTAALAVVRHPTLWPTALVQLFALAQPGWWRRWPPLPAPDPEYLRFRLQTQYGDPDREPEREDLIAYLKWCKGYRAVVR